MTSAPYPYSNYSLSLGFATEIGYWTPDVMPEDIHTANKAMVNNFGSMTTVTVPSIICNDLVSGLGDRYQQAKRHQYGSVTECAWLVSVLLDMKLRFPAWWALFKSETVRPGSFIGTLACIASCFMELLFLVLVTSHWSTLPAKAQLLLRLGGAYMMWTWLWFWIAEVTMWRTLLTQFPIQHPSWWRWTLLLLAMPSMSSVNLVVFLILPTLHALFHAVFIGELAYVCAPKGVGE
jgi:hypothetical protein